MTELTDNTLTASIVCYETDSHQLQALIDSLLDSLLYLQSSAIPMTSTIVLVDNSEDSNGKYSLALDQFVQFGEKISKSKTELKLIKGQGNVGYGAGHNLSIKASTDAYYLILNPDVVLDRCSLVEGISFLEKNPQVAIVSPSAIDEAGEKQYLCKRYPALSILLVRGLFPNWLKKLFHRSQARYEMHDLSEQSPSDSIPLVSGCYMLCRGDSLRSVGGFDENYFLYFEDFDLSWRIGRKGKLAYLPAMKIVHSGGNTATKGFKHIRMFVKSGFRFFNQFGWRLIQ